jgi:hypothetical protein
MTTSYFTLGSSAKGTIQPRPDQRERLEEVTDRVRNGEFHVPIASHVTLPVRCVDGRSALNPTLPAPNSAGGTESLFVADDLTVKRFTGQDGTTLAGYVEVVTFLKQAGYEVGGHTDTHAGGEKSGCGANDRLKEIYRYIAEHGDILKGLAARLGVRVSDDTHNLIQANAAKRTQFSKGAELFAYLKQSGQPEFVDTLDGEHNEVLAVVNTVPQSTLDRAALAREFGPNYQAFNVDVWAFKDAARVLSGVESEIAQKVAALVYYNLATTMVLAGPELRVVVRA